MDDWQSDIAETITDAFDRALNAYVDVEIMQATGIRQGPTFAGNTQQGTQILRAGGTTGQQGGMMLPNWLPMLAIGAAVALVVWKAVK